MKAKSKLSPFEKVNERRFILFFEQSLSSMSEALFTDEETEEQDEDTGEYVSYLYSKNPYTKEQIEAAFKTFIDFFVSKKEIQSYSINITKCTSTSLKIDITIKRNNSSSEFSMHQKFR